MATIITHGLVAGALSTVAPGDLPRARLAIVLALLAMLPDIDVLGFSSVFHTGTLSGTEDSPTRLCLLLSQVS